MSQNWIAFIPFDGEEPYVNTGDLPHFALLEEGMPELRSEINQIAAGHLPHSSQGVFAKGEITPGGYVKFQDAIGDRNIIADVVYNYLARTSSVHTAAINSPEQAVKQIKILVGGKNFRNALISTLKRAGATNSDNARDDGLVETYNDKYDVAHPLLPFNELADLASIELVKSFEVMAGLRSVATPGFYIPFAVQKNEILSLEVLIKSAEELASWTAQNVLGDMRDALTGRTNDLLAEISELEDSVNANQITQGEMLSQLADLYIELRRDTVANVEGGLEEDVPDLPMSIVVQNREKAATKGGVIYDSSIAWDPKSPHNGRGGYKSWYPFVEKLIEDMSAGRLDMPLEDTRHPVLSWLFDFTFLTADEGKIFVGSCERWPDGSTVGLAKAGSLARAIATWDYLNTYKLSEKFDSDPGNRDIPVKDRLVQLSPEIIEYVRRPMVSLTSQPSLEGISYVATKDVASGIKKATEYAERDGLLPSTTLNASLVIAAKRVIDHSQHSNNVKRVAETFGLGGTLMTFPGDEGGGEWQIFRLDKYEDLQAEGACLHHCIGDSRQYAEYVDANMAENFSIRKNGVPVATLTLGKYEDAEGVEYGVHQLKSFNNDAPPFESTGTIAKLFDLLDVQIIGSNRSTLRNENGDREEVTFQEFYSYFLSGDRGLFDKAMLVKQEYGWSFSDGPSPSSMFDVKTDMQNLGRYVYADWLEEKWDDDPKELARVFEASGRNEVDKELLPDFVLPKRTKITPIMSLWFRKLQSETENINDLVEIVKTADFLQEIQNNLNDDNRRLFCDECSNYYSHIKNTLKLLFLYPLIDDQDLAKAIDSESGRQLTLGETPDETIEEFVYSLMEESLAKIGFREIMTTSASGAYLSGGINSAIRHFSSNIVNAHAKIISDAYDKYEDGLLENNEFIVSYDLNRDNPKNVVDILLYRFNRRLQDVYESTATHLENLHNSKFAEDRIQQLSLSDAELHLQKTNLKNAIYHLLVANSEDKSFARERGVVSKNSYMPYRLLFCNELLSMAEGYNINDVRSGEIFSALARYLSGFASERQVMMQFGYEEDAGFWKKNPNEFDFFYLPYALSPPVGFLKEDFGEAYEKSPERAKTFFFDDTISSRPYAITGFSHFDDHEILELYQEFPSIIGAHPNGEVIQRLKQFSYERPEDTGEDADDSANNYVLNAINEDLKAAQEYQQNPLPEFHEIKSPEGLEHVSFSPNSTVLEIQKEIGEQICRLAGRAIMQSPQAKNPAILSFALALSENPVWDENISENFYRFFKNGHAKEIPFGYPRDQNDESKIKTIDDSVEKERYFYAFVKNFLNDEDRKDFENLLEIEDTISYLAAHLDVTYPLKSLADEDGSRTITNSWIREVFRNKQGRFLVEPVSKIKNILESFGLSSDSPYYDIDYIKKQDFITGLLRDSYSYYQSPEWGLLPDRKKRILMDVFFNEHGRRLLGPSDVDSALTKFEGELYNIISDLLDVSDFAGKAVVSYMSDDIEKILQRLKEARSLVGFPQDPSLESRLQKTIGESAAKDSVADKFFTPLSGFTAGEVNAASLIGPKRNEGISFQNAVRMKVSEDEYKECPECGGDGLSSLGLEKPPALLCSVCDGVAFLPVCEDCAGSGLQSCGACEEGECQTCSRYGDNNGNGEGKIKCEHCDEEGDVQCPECEGSGQIEGEEGEGEECERCSGHGYIPCLEECDGGYIDCPGDHCNEGRCTECYGEGEITCHCNNDYYDAEDMITGIDMSAIQMPDPFNYGAYNMELAASGDSFRARRYAVMKETAWCPDCEGWGIFVMNDVPPQDSLFDAKDFQTESICKTCSGFGFVDDWVIDTPKENKQEKQIQFEKEQQPQELPPQWQQVTEQEAQQIANNDIERLVSGFQYPGDQDRIRNIFAENGILQMEDFGPITPQSFGMMLSPHFPEGQGRIMELWNEAVRIYTQYEQERNNV